MVLVALLALVAGCGDEQGDRPSAAEWTVEWEALRDGVPVGPEPSQDACGSFLADLRSAREEMIPAPAEQLDGVIRSWFESAEELVFDCDSDSYPEGLAELEILTAEVDGGLEAL